MRSHSVLAAVAMGLVILLSNGVLRAADGDADALLKMMPASTPFSIVIMDFEKLDKNVAGIQKRFDPGRSGVGLLADFKGEVKIANWIDFTKPVGMVNVTMDETAPVIWAYIPGFANKVKEFEGATEEDGIWILAFESAGNVYAKDLGGYVAASQSREQLLQATEPGPSLASATKSQLGLMRNRDVLIHANFDLIRPGLLGGIAQIAPMAPMVAMMAGQQAGAANPAAITGAITGALDAAKTFVEQVASVDVAIGLSDQDADITIATRYKDGPIQEYLTQQTPATMPFFQKMQDQAFLLAVGYHVPGKKSPFFDYIIDKTFGAIASAQGTDDGDAEAQLAESKKAADVARELYRKIEGMEVVMAPSPSGMRMTGHYVGSDMPGLTDLVKSAIAGANPMMQQVKGATYEALESRTIGGATVEQYAVRMDPASPAAGMMGAMLGDDARLGLGLRDGGLRYCLGSPGDLDMAFGGSVTKPLATSDRVVSALAKLPKNRNAVVLLDPAAIMALVGPAMGMPAIGAVPPGPPIAISASLTGGVARVDIHIPFRAIDRVIQAAAPNEPM